MEAVTSVLLEREAQAGRVGPMATLSLLAHAVAIALLIFLPAGWGARSAPDPLSNAMVISLGGAPGPRAGGMTPMGGRPVQASEPESAAKRPEPARPPAAKTPEMVLPAPGKPLPAAKPVKAAPEDAKGRTPAKGQEAQAGNAVAETGAKGLGFGLSTGGGGAGGYLDVGDFCCPDYLSTMIQLLQRNWNSKQQVAAENMVRFTILRDGAITEVDLERSSGYAALDLTSQRALLLTRQLPPLPTAFPNDHLTVHLRFQYQP